MKILITGSAGLIGTAATQVLQEAGFSLRTFDRDGTTGAEGIEHHTGDLRDFTTVKRVMEGMDAVVHGGAIAYDRPGDDDQVLGVNVGGTLNVMWHADADFLAETYKGSDAYVTKDGLMYAQVTTFDGAKLKFKP